MDRRVGFGFGFGFGFGGLPKSCPRRLSRLTPNFQLRKKYLGELLDQSLVGYPGDCTIKLN